MNPELSLLTYILHSPVRITIIGSQAGANDGYSSSSSGSSSSGSDSDSGSSSD